MNAKSLIIVFGALLTIQGSAMGSIIDDKSQFVGDFAVIDFETRGDGSPVTEPFYVEPEEYRNLGVSIALGAPPHEFARPLITYVVNSEFIGAHQIAGSPPYVLIDETSGDLLRFDFDGPINAVGVTILNGGGDRMPGLEVYDASGSLIEELLFQGDLIDGTIIDSGPGVQTDVDYGFFGIYTPDNEIAYALLYEGRSWFDDLHFGVIPEPATLVLLMVGLPVLLRGRPRRARMKFSATAAVSVLIVGGISASATEPDISGRVTGFATPFDGTYLPDTTENLPVEMDLEGVRVWLDGVTPEVSTHTLADGTYEFNNVPVAPPVTVRAYLLGEWAYVPGADPVSEVVSLFPAAAIDFTFNTQPTELGTAQVNAFVHLTKAHNFWTRFGITPLDSVVDSEPAPSYYGMSTKLVMKGGQV